MPDGSSSEAPVTRPGPRISRNRPSQVGRRAGGPAAFTTPGVSVSGVAMRRHCPASSAEVGRIPANRAPLLAAPGRGRYSDPRPPLRDTFMRTVRTALVGCGKVGHLHAAALRELPLAEFVGV